MLSGTHMLVDKRGTIREIRLNCRNSCTGAKTADVLIFVPRPNQKCSLQENPH